MTIFQKKVYDACKKIPKGKVSTYGEIAKYIGNPDSSRAVGNALSVNPFAPKVPCHRVVKGDGTLGGFATGLENKIALLKEEGVLVKENRVQHLQKIKHLFD